MTSERKSVAYVTMESPFGRGEAFVLHEMLALVELGVDLVILPRRHDRTIRHERGRELVARTETSNLLAPAAFLALLREVIARPRRTLRIFRGVVRQTRLPVDLAKAILVLPHAFYLAGRLSNKDVCHVHAHSTSTLSVIAFVLSEMLNVPWSFTLHAGGWILDRRHETMIREKTRSAEWVRCGSDQIRRELAEVVGPGLIGKLHVVYLGLDTSRVLIATAREAHIRPVVIAVPAAFLERKGHAYLLQAFRLMVDSGTTDFICEFIGEGPLGGQLRERIESMGLGERVFLRPPVPNDELLTRYARREIDIVALPSVETRRLDKEGMPAALYEAMAYAIPIVSTTTGSIPELVGSAGILVEPGNPPALAQALVELISDAKRRAELGARAQTRIHHIGADARSNAASLMALFCRPRP